MHSKSGTRPKYLYFILITFLLLTLTACEGQDLGGADGKSMTITFHYISGGRDNPVKREIPRPAEDQIREMARALVEDFHNPAQIGKTHPIIPPGTKLLDLKIIDGLAYLDFSREMRDNHFGGLEAEVNTIYSLVQTLTQFPQVKAVQFLIEGQQVKTIATGAIDLTEPVRPLTPSQITPDMYKTYTEKIALTPAGTLNWSQVVQEEGSFALAPGEFTALAWGDPTAEGRAQVVVATEEKVAVWAPTGGAYRQAWESPLKAVQRLYLGKTTGKKQAEIIACTDRQVYVFTPEEGGYRRLGTIEVTAPLLSTAVGDTTGDGQEEIILLYGDGDPSQSDYTATVEIWQFGQGNFEKTFRVEGLPYTRMEVAPVTGKNRREIIAFGQQGLTFYAWNGKAYAEIYKNPGIDAHHTTLNCGDFTGGGQRELVLWDDKRQDIYVYTYAGEHLRKVWQGNIGSPGTLFQPLLWQNSTGRGPQELLLPTPGQGGYRLLTWKEGAPVLYSLEGKDVEGITAILPGPGGRLLYSRQISADGPRYRIYVGCRRQPELVT